MRRLGLSTFRIAMIFTTPRFFAPPFRGGREGLLVCNDADFNTALTITKTLIHHAALIFQRLPTETPAHTEYFASTKIIVIFTAGVR